MVSLTKTRYDGMRMTMKGEKKMNSSWRFFVVVEALLLLFAVWQIVNNTGLLLLVIFGIFNIYLAMRKYPRTKFQNFQRNLPQIFQHMISTYTHLRIIATYYL